MIKKFYDIDEHECKICGILISEVDFAKHICPPDLLLKKATEKYEREAIMDTKELVVRDEKQPAILTLMESPEKAVAMYDDIKKNFLSLLKKNGEVIKVKGKDYVKYEGWQTIGTALGILPRVIEVIPIEGGYQGKAEAVLVKTGRVVGQAYGLCTKDELNWKDKPMFGLMAMAQTRASGRALKMILSGFIAHCGFEATLAEEIIETNGGVVAPTEETTHSEVISEKQQKRLYAIGKESGMPAEEFKTWLKEKYGYEHTKNILREHYDAICEYVEGYKQ